MRAHRYSGAVFLLVSGGLFVATNVTIRLAVSDLHPTVVFFFRNLLSLPFFIPWILRAGRAEWRSNHKVLHGLRVIAFCVAMVSWYSALTMVPFAHAEAVQFAAPVFATVGGIVFLGERSSLARWLALALGLIGVLTVIRPEFISLSAGTALALVSALFLATMRLLTRVLAGSDSVGTIMLYLTVGAIPVSLLIAVPFWQWPDLRELILLLLIAGIGTLAHYTMTRAYKLSDVGFLEPFNFVRIIWASIIGLLYFGEGMDWFNIIGSLIVVVSIGLVVRSSGRKAED